MTKVSIDENIAIGLIPARGGSKSIPLKNIVPISGRPMISYVIEAGLKAKTLSRVLCSTDHIAIADVCSSLGIEVLDRPMHLGQDDTPVTAVILDVLNTLAERDMRLPGLVALLQPTSPFMLATHIDACVSALLANPDADSAQTVAPIFHNAHAYNQRVIENGRVMFRFAEERKQAYNKQKKPKHYTFGNVVVTRTKALLAGEDCFGRSSVPVEISRAYAFDVDTSEDVMYADYLVRSGNIDLSIS